MNKCLNCNKETKNSKFCSKSCSASYNNIGIRRHGKKPGNCLNCGKKLTTTIKKCCNTKCHYEYKEQTYIKEWKEGKKTGNTGKKYIDLSVIIERYIKQKFNNKCTKCSWSEINTFSGNIPLQIHHIDGNKQNSTENNLDLLCPNCHSLTENWGKIKRSSMV